ncbi:MAG: biotin/lipoyl-containing protein [Parasphingorhabdus sp.]
MTEIRVPEGQWETDQEAALATWLYADGEAVSTGVTVCEIMVEKTSFEVPAPAGGVLAIAIAEDDVVVPGQIIGTIT